MCELFAVNAAGNVDVTGYVKEFFTHSVRHPHGWGMALFHGNGAVSLEKEPVAAYESQYLKERLKQKIEVPSMLAHIRYATIGGMDYSNCHPFVDRDASGRNWTLIHNGTIFDYPQLSAYLFQQEGHTDSERILLYLIDQLNWARASFRTNELDAWDRFNLLDSIVCDMSKGNKLNLIIYDGELMYVHTNYKDSLYSSYQNGALLFCTTPLRQGEWRPVPFTTLLAFEKGHLRYTGTNHGNEFIDDPEKTKYLYTGFANP